MKFIPKVRVMKNGLSINQNIVESYYSLIKEKNVLGIFIK
jgi:hypothetical protein